MNTEPVKKRKIKSVCGKYSLTYSTHVSDGCIRTIDGLEYTNALKEGKNGAYYSTPHMMSGYSDYAEGMPAGKFFTMRFMDCKSGVRIIPFKGNAVLKYHKAIFRVQKVKATQSPKQ